MEIFTTKRQIITAFPRAKVLRDRGGSAVFGDVGTGTGAAVSSWLESYFEYDSVNKALILTNPDEGGEISFANDDGDIVAYSDYGGTPPSFWDGLPIATASILGGVKVGSGLAVTAGGVLSATGGLDFQTLSFANPDLSISDGNTVDLSALTPDLSGYYTKTETDTWRSDVSQTEMSYLDGVTSDIQTQFSNIYTKTEANDRFAETATANTFLANQTIAGSFPTLRVEGTGSGRLQLGDSDGTTGQRNFDIRSDGGEIRFSSLNDAWSAFVSQNFLVCKYTGELIFRYHRAKDTNGIDFQISTGSRYWMMENDGDFHSKGDVIAFSTTV